MIKTFKYRIYPNKTQQMLIQKTFGCVRFVYNYYLDKRKTLYHNEQKSMNFYACSKNLTNLKKELVWLQEPDKWALQNTLKDLDNAYLRFFKKLTNYPKFKTKKSHYHSYRTTNTKNSIRFLNKHIRLPKLGNVKIKDKRMIEGRILYATIMQVPSGKYYCFICCGDIEILVPPKTNQQIGIDLGLKYFAVTSDNEKIHNPTYLKKSLDKLIKLQRELSRKTRGSSNWNKMRIKVARMHEKIANQRYDFLHKLTTDLINKYDVIVIEKLCVNNMTKQYHIARQIFDVSWFKFIQLLTYKADWYNKRVVVIDRFFPSSQLCSNCGYQNSDIKNLHIRRWICPECNTLHDRDVNAAKNILTEGLRMIS